MRKIQGDQITKSNVRRGTHLNLRDWRNIYPCGRISPYHLYLIQINALVSAMRFTAFCHMFVIPYCSAWMFQISSLPPSSCYITLAFTCLWCKFPMQSFFKFCGDHNPGPPFSKDTFILFWPATWLYLTARFNAFVEYMRAINSFGIELQAKWGLVSIAYLQTLFVLKGATLQFKNPCWCLFFPAL